MKDSRLKRVALMQNFVPYKNLTINQKVNLRSYFINLIEVLNANEKDGFTKKDCNYYVTKESQHKELSAIPIIRNNDYTDRTNGLFQ